MKLRNMAKNSLEKIFEVFFKKLLTTRFFCAIIYIVVRVLTSKTVGV